MSRIKKKLKNQAERFVMLQKDVDIAKIESLAKSKGCTKSWIYRAILFALEKKYQNELPEEVIIKRPKKFKDHFRQITVCFHGDREKWFSLCRIWHVELGPLIRFGLLLYEKGELNIDLENERTTKEIRVSKNGKIIKTKKTLDCSIYMYHNDNILYSKSEYWPKSRVKNLLLMKRGLKNRKYKLILPIDFEIPNCFL